MLTNEQWIWLDDQIEPECQFTKYSGLMPGDSTFSVVEFKRTYEFENEISDVELRFSGDTEYRLNCNGKFVATGPATIPGDFLYTDSVRPWHYASRVTLPVNAKLLEFRVRVKLMPCGINEYSQGHGGWYLAGIVHFADGTQTFIQTDETWQVRKNPRYTAPGVYDGSLNLPDYSNAKVVENIWHCTDSPLVPRVEERINENPVIVPPFSAKSFDFDFQAIYAGMIALYVCTSSVLHVKVECLETDVVNAEERFTFTEDTDYIGLQLHSIGRYRLYAENRGDSSAELTLAIQCTHAPAEHCAHTITSDRMLNSVLRQCEHALKHCRQMTHLDSPLHSEPLACTGDYYVETLMTAFSFGDFSLAEFDVIRTAEMIRWQKGQLFHTTYSLTWVLWLHDLYWFTGNKQLLVECEDTLHILLERFQTYIGDSGLIENPPNFMFVDWLYLDGYSLHHPPKALGQTCLNLFYATALEKAEKICRILNSSCADDYHEEHRRICAAINERLFDPHKQLYFEGLNTPTPPELIHEYMPENAQKRYYRIHANLLAVYAGVYPGDPTAFLNRILELEELGEYQPYFAHYAMEALNQTGLADRYMLKLCERWKEAYRSCPKGLQEGFIKPEPSYSFDHSHAWGGTPLYSVPLALSGLKILEPGMRRIQLTPNLLGMDEAMVEIPTPFGTLRISMRRGESPVIEAPEGLEIVL